MVRKDFAAFFSVVMKADAVVMAAINSINTYIEATFMMWISLCHAQMKLNAKTSYRSFI